MRSRVLGLTIAGTLVQAGGAAAQSDMMPMMNNQLPAQAHDQFTGQPPPMPTKHDRYLMKLASLRDKTLRTKAKDGGQLTSEHAAALQHELDDLNKAFGITAG
jgi:hypothetical protein